ncbi:MAG: acyl-CoA thioesterase, partial [Planctomycetota bacterium]
MARTNVTTIRVRYGEVDRMNTVYNARVLEWFEVARTEHLREMGLPYSEIESKGIYFPVIEARVQFQGRATYDDVLRLKTSLSRPSRLRLTFHITVDQQKTGRSVATGFTTHA